MTKYLYHVHVRVIDAPHTQSMAVLSAAYYQDALVEAKKRLDVATDDTLVEITHAGLVIWGPYINGGKFAP